MSPIAPPERNALPELLYLLHRDPADLADALPGARAACHPERTRRIGMRGSRSFGRWRALRMTAWYVILSAREGSACVEADPSAAGASSG
jgi:hypothetical protein